MLIKADILELAEKEEEKIRFAEFAKEAEAARKRVLNYETYFGVDPSKDASPSVKPTEFGSIKGDTTFEQFVAAKQSDNIFHQDMAELEYKFWEGPEERVERLKNIWIDLKKKNALGGIE